MANQFLGNGTVLTFTPSSTNVAVTLGNVMSIDGPDAQRDSVDVTALDSTTPWRSFLIGDGDPGTVTLTLMYDNQDDAQIRLNALLAGSTAATFTLTYNTSLLDADSFTAFVVGRGRSIERNSVIETPVTLKITGAPGFAVST